jgi:hypothetical protein
MNLRHGMCLINKCVRPTADLVLVALLCCGRPYGPYFQIDNYADAKVY